MRAPAALSASTAATVKRDVKILKSVENFHIMVHALLTNPAERAQFFKEDFPVEYGPTFDQELEKMLWEFLIRLDQLLPVPNLAQTVSWLSDAPPVLEECAQAATQPQLLKILLQHQTCLGHLETAASLPPNMGDSILASLSLPPSGRVPSDQPTGTQNKTSFITPVFGLISNEEVPVMTSASKETERGETNNKTTKQDSKFTVVKERLNPEDDRATEGRDASRRSGGVKRKQPDNSESREQEEEFSVITSGPNRTGQSLRNGGIKTDRKALEASMARLGVKTLHLPQDPSVSSAFVSCLSRQPSVVIERLSVTSAGDYQSSETSPTKGENQKRKSPRKATQKRTTDQLQMPDSDFSGLDNKENRPMTQSASSFYSPQRSKAVSSALQGDGEDYVADSEDEATKNFKGRLFMKRYCKTKHGTFVPTLREYWKPGMTGPMLTSAGSKRRR
ncbi:uncharacterized protein V6R79_018638 [Siganus canaliculatus]